MPSTHAEDHSDAQVSLGRRCRKFWRNFGNECRRSVHLPEPSRALFPRDSPPGGKSNCTKLHVGGARCYATCITLLQKFGELKRHRGHAPGALGFASINPNRERSRSFRVRNRLDFRRAKSSYNTQIVLTRSPVTFREPSAADHVAI